eukprot:tig00020629_g12465.t1
MEAPLAGWSYTPEQIADVKRRGKDAGKRLIKQLLSGSGELFSLSGRSFLQRAAELFRYAPLLSQAAQSADPARRLHLVIGTILGGLHLVVRDPYRPFTSLPGETYEAELGDGARFYAQGVARFPRPMMGVSLEGPGYVLRGTLGLVPHLNWTSLHVEPMGDMSVSFADGARVAFRLPKLLFPSLVLSWTKRVLLEGDASFAYYSPGGAVAAWALAEFSEGPSASASASASPEPSPSRWAFWRRRSTGGAAGPAQENRITVAVREGPGPAGRLLGAGEGVFGHRGAYRTSDGVTVWDLSPPPAQPSPRVLPTDSRLRPDAARLRAGDAAGAYQIKQELKRLVKAAEEGRPIACQLPPGNPSCRPLLDWFLALRAPAREA